MILRLGFAILLLPGISLAKEITTNYVVQLNSGTTASTLKGMPEAQAVIGKSILDPVIKALQKSTAVQNLWVIKGDEVLVSGNEEWAVGITRARESHLFVMLNLGPKSISMQFLVNEENVTCKPGAQMPGPITPGPKLPAGFAEGYDEYDDEGSEGDSYEDYCLYSQMSTVRITGPTKIHGNFAITAIDQTDRLMINAQTLTVQASKPYANNEDLLLQTTFTMNDRLFIQNLKKFLTSYSMSSLLLDPSKETVSNQLFLQATSRWMREINEGIISNL